MRLINVPILRVVIPKSGNLVRCLALDDMISLTTIPLLVLPPQQDRCQTKQATGSKDETQSGTVAQLVLGLVFGTVQESAVDAGTVAESHAGPLAGGALEVAREVVGHPRDGDADCNVEAARHDHTTGVLGARAVLWRA